MCGAFGFSSGVNIQLRYELNNSPKFSPSYNIRPSLPALTITRHSPNQGHVRNFGISAPWDEKHLIINAMSETVAEKRTFSKLFRESRCLVPASFYFEWKKLSDGKQPYCFKVKETDCFSLAGLYRDDGFVILTTKPNSLQSPIHSRMPCILTKEDEDVWLNPDTEEEKLHSLLKPFSSEMMETFPVSSLVNSPKNNFPEILKPVKVD